MSNLLKRTVSAIILAPLFLYICYIGGKPYFLMVSFIFAVMFYEWVGMTKKLDKKVLWWVFGLMYLGVAFFTMLYLEQIRRPQMFGLENPPMLLFLIILLVWVNDVFSYFFGKGIGGPKLAPKISPNKTWSGAVGGLIGCLGLFFVANYVSTFKAGSAVSDKVFYTSLVIHLIIPVISQIGDLFESYIKRKCKVKDSGNILPGHGGLLDRFDGFVLVLFVYGIYTFVTIYSRVLGQIPS